MPESIKPGSDRKVALEEILSGAIVKLPEVSRARIRGNVLVSVTVTPKPGFAGAMFMRAAAAFSALAIGMGGLSYAAASALPGSVLYPVKRAVEETQVALTPGDANKADALQEMADERVREIHKLIEMDASRESMGKAVSGFKDAAERAIEADPEQARQRASEIEESVESVPDPVRERINEQVPAPSPEPEPKKSEPTDPEGSSGSGSQSGDSQPPAGQSGSGSGGTSGSSDSSGGSGDSGAGKP